jgi:flagellar M-ring protein FliF
VNFRQVSSVEEIYDADKQALRSVQEEGEKLRGNRSTASGAPGARANLPGGEDASSGNGFKQDVDKELKTTNYDNTKMVRNTKEPVGAIERLSVSVLVDGVTSSTTEDGKTVEKWTPRSAEELAQYETIVKSAIGFDEKRGDVVKVENLRFQKEDFAESDKLLNSLEKRKLVSYMVKWGILALIFGAFFLLVVRPFMRWITESFQDSVDQMLPKTIEELEDLQTVDNSLPGMGGALPMLEESLDPDKAESELLKERIMALVQGDSKKAAYALNQWIDERRAAS